MATQSFAPREAFSRVELSLSCENLKDLDHFSKSDPAVFIYQASRNGDTWVLIDKTEVIDNNLNPKVHCVHVLVLLALKHSLIAMCVI